VRSLLWEDCTYWPAAGAGFSSGARAGLNALKPSPARKRFLSATQGRRIPIRNSIPLASVSQTIENRISRAAVPRRGVRWRPGLTDKQIVLPSRTRVGTANELFTHKEGLVIRARRVEVHAPTLLICLPLGRLTNVEGARPTLFCASKANERAGTP
jgi:hypothetical protein